MASSGAGQRHELIPEAGTAVDADPGDERGGADRCSWRTVMLPTLSTTLPRGVWSPREMQQLLRISIWRNCWNWGWRSSASSRGQLRIQRRRMWRHPPQAPNRRVTEVGDLEDLSIWNTQLVVGAKHGTWGGWLWKAGTWGTGLFSTPEEGEWTMPSEEWPSGPTCTTVSLLEEFLAATRFYLHLLGYLGNSVWENGGIHPGPSVLGGEGWSVYWR